MTSRMRALLGGAGPDWEVREVDVPAPGPGQLLVRVRAAALNRADLLMLQGTYNPKVKTGDLFVAGLEFSGTVAAFGPDVKNFALGDRVMGVALGAFATYTLVDHRHVLPVPESLPWAEAAALPVGLATEYDALVQGGFAPGQSVLVTGATSDVGLVAVQLARALGAAQVIATTTSAAKTDTLKRLGVDVVVDTAAEKLAEDVGAATGGTGVDLVLDHVGGQLLTEAFAATRIGGTVVTIDHPAGAVSTLDLDQLATVRIQLQGTTFSARTPDELADTSAAVAREILHVVEHERVHAVIDRVFPFNDAQAAADRMRSNQAIGRILLELPRPGHSVTRTPGPSQAASVTPGSRRASRPPTSLSTPRTPLS
ncbi:zinc-binding dehydrogenase [Streptomyces sp. NPDC001833]|uniref:quinone oxidoreductase family protein n=1 Tax=Streptomyces sp. NPDC001833 TaxID=3154658 RepID=UPI00331DE1E9